MSPSKATVIFEGDRGVAPSATPPVLLGILAVEQPKATPFPVSPRAREGVALGVHDANSGSSQIQPVPKLGFSVEPPSFLRVLCSVLRLMPAALPSAITSAAIR